MKCSDYTDEQILAAMQECNDNKVKAARQLGVARSTLRNRLETISREQVNNPDASCRITQQRDSCIIESAGVYVKTVAEALKRAEIDLDIWEVDRAVVNAYDVTMKIRSGGVDKPTKTQNYQIKIWLKRKVPKSVEDAVERLLDKLRAKSPIAPAIKRRPLSKLPHRHSLEPCLMDPHFGLRCFKPGADADWSPEMCAAMVMDSLDEILRLAEPYQPFEEIVLPLGNDFFHTDSIWQVTTSGTGQPEADAYLHTFIGGESLAIAIVDKLKQLAPVTVYIIPGNHDRATSFMLGRILRAYYHRDKNITVHADESPYKFHRYGVNLIGYEHGHSVKAIRLAALMANECPEHWLATKHGYREWHLGDQHRKGSSTPARMEEQGVSVEYLPGLVAPNEWHRLKSFNWQKRGTMAFVWDYSAGPIARLQVNIDRYLNRLMGTS